jgi:hypothetical protein
VGLTIVLLYVYVHSCRTYYNAGTGVGMFSVNDTPRSGSFQCSGVSSFTENGALIASVRELVRDDLLVQGLRPLAFCTNYKTYINKIGKC